MPVWVNAFTHTIVCMAGGRCPAVAGGVSTGVVAQVLPMYLLDVDAYELLGLARGRNYGNSDINRAYIVFSDPYARCHILARSETVFLTGPK